MRLMGRLNSSGLIGRDPLVDFVSDLFLGIAVSLLQRAFELFALTVNSRNVVVSQLAPLAAHLANKLAPFAFDNVPVHLLMDSPLRSLSGSYGLSVVPDPADGI